MYERRTGYTITEPVCKCILYTFSDLQLLYVISFIFCIYHVTSNFLQENAVPEPILKLTNIKQQENPDARSFLLHYSRSFRLRLVNVKQSLFRNNGFRAIARDPGSFDYFPFVIA